MLCCLFQNGSAPVVKKQPFGGRKRKMDEDVSTVSCVV